MTKMIDGRVRGDAPQPRATISHGRVEAGVGPVHAPESFQGQILGHRGVADDAHEPAVNFALVLPEKRFKGIHIARRESLQQSHAPPLFTLTVREAPRLHYFKGRAWRRLKETGQAFTGVVSRRVVKGGRAAWLLSEATSTCLAG